MIHRIFRPARLLHVGWLGGGRGQKCPMVTVFGPFGNPAPEKFFLLRRQYFVDFCRRHPLVLIIGEYAADDLTLLRLARNYGNRAGLGGLQCFLTHIEPQLGLAGPGIETMAAKARVRHDGPDVTIEIYFGRPNPETKTQREKNCEPGKSAH